MKKSNDYIGEFEEMVLLAIASIGDGAYGVSIHNAIEDATNRSVSIGALYTTLSRLQDKGLVRSWEGQPTAERGGRVKRYYKVETAGKKLLLETESSRRKLRGLKSAPV